MTVTINGTTGIDKVQDGSVSIADLSATGTPSSSNFLRGDGSWQVAGASTDYGGIGSYVMAGTTTGTTASGSTVAGSSLVRQTTNYANGYSGYVLVQTGGSSSLGLSGTWRAMTNANNDASYYSLALWVRIS